MKAIWTYALFVSSLTWLTTVHGLYRFGPTEGDTELQDSRMDDGDSGEILLNGTYGFYGQSYSSLWVNINGNLMFDGDNPQYWPSDVPFDSVEYGTGSAMIAPLWTDISLEEKPLINVGNGHIWYRETTDPLFLCEAAGDNRCSFHCLDFSPTHAFVVTWDNVEPYNELRTYCDTYPISYYPYYYYYDCHVGGYNPTARGEDTFQCVILTDGANTLVVYYYEKIEWLYSESDYLYPLAGFNAGDGIRSWQHPASYTEHMDSVTRTTNVGKPGVWKFKVDGGLLLEPQNLCPTEDMCTCSLTSSSFVYNFDGYPNNQIKAAQKTTLVEYNQGTVDPCKFRLRVETKADGANFSVKKVYFSVGVHPNNVDNHYRSIMISGNQVKERGHGINSQAVATPYWWMSSDTKTDLDVVEDGDWVRVRNTQCSWFLDVDRSHGNDDLRLTFTTGYTGGVVDGFCGNCDGVADPFMSHEDQTALWAVEDDD